MGNFLTNMAKGLAKGWFTLLFVLNLLGCWACVSFMNLVGVEPTKKQRLTCYFCHYFFRIPFVFSPWLDVRNAPAADWDKLATGKGAFVMLNHTSMLDAIVFIAYAPMNVLLNYRTLLKSGLLEMPVFGTIAKAAGHFPVYFASSANGAFSVEKDKMEKVMNDVNAHVQAGGGISMFPEGQLNKYPLKLQTFRHGSFALPMQHKLKMFCCVISGVDRCFPLRDKMGGIPSTMQIDLWQLDDAVVEKLATKEALSVYAQQEMQKGVDARKALYHPRSAPPPENKADSKAEAK